MSAWKYLVGPVSQLLSSRYSIDGIKQSVRGCTLSTREHRVVLLRKRKRPLLELSGFVLASLSPLRRSRNGNEPVSLSRCRHTCSERSLLRQNQIGTYRLGIRRCTASLRSCFTGGSVERAIWLGNSCLFVIGFISEYRSDVGRKLAETTRRANDASNHE